MRAAKIDQPLKTKQQLISVCFQAIVSRFRRDQSGEASDLEMEEEGQAGSDAAQKTASGAARKTADAGQQGSQANPGVSGSGAAAVIPPAPITYDQFAMHTNPQLNAGSDSGSDFQAKRQYMIDQIMGSNVSAAAKSQQINAVMDLLSSVPAPVSSLRSSGRSSQPEPFNGRAADHGQTAISWLYSVELYFAAEPTSNPVAKAVTYLHSDARYWWQQAGSLAMPSTATFADFKKVFLARFVKPSDSAAARLEIPKLKQTDSVEAYVAEFNAVNARIQFGTPIDTSTLAGYFMQGLKTKIAKSIAQTEPIEVTHDLVKLMSAVEGMEAKLNLADKQAQPSLAAMHHAAGRYTPQRGGHAQARMPRPNNGPYNRGNAQYPPPQPPNWDAQSYGPSPSSERGRQQGRGRSGRGRSQASGSNSAPGSAQQANSNSAPSSAQQAGRGSPAGNANSVAPGAGGSSRWCKTNTHNTTQCRYLKDWER